MQTTTKARLTRAQALILLQTPLIQREETDTPTDEREDGWQFCLLKGPVRGLVCLWAWKIHLIWKCCATAKHCDLSTQHSTLQLHVRSKQSAGLQGKNSLSSLRFLKTASLTEGIQRQHLTQKLGKKAGAHLLPLMPRWQLERQIKRTDIFKSLTPSHHGMQAVLRSNRLTQFLWLWCTFCSSSRTVTEKGGN